MVEVPDAKQGTRDMSGTAGPAPQGGRPRLVALDTRNVWRVGWVVVAVVALTALARFVLVDGGSVIYLVVMAWFASLALEPAVRRFSRVMPRPAATALVMVLVVVFLVGFFVAFGQLFVRQVAQLVEMLPDLTQASIDWVNRTFRTSYSVDDAIKALNLTPEQVASYAAGVLGGVLGIFGSLVSTLFNGFTFALLTFYLTADGPRLRRWIAERLPDGRQELFVTAWDLTTTKTGGYVAARVVLAAINGATSALVFAVVGLPSWLALGLWTGVVAQFVPTIGTYVSIVLPVLVGLLSPHPWTGIVALVWAALYQQVENLTIEPRISARAVNVHPAVAFVSVLLGSALFGVGGALLAIPVVAMLLALFELRREAAQDALPEPAAEASTG
jgi:predicted PurR-regulated permease PerM